MTEKHSSKNDPGSGEWNDSLSGDFLWSNVNFGEAVTDVMTPLTWSVIKFTLDNWVFIPGYSTAGNIGGYPYLNISIFATMFHALKRSRQDLFDTMEGTLYMRLPEDLEIPLIRLSSMQRVAAMLSSVHVQIKQSRGIKSLPRYLRDNPAWSDSIEERIRAEQSKFGLLEMWQQEIKPHVKGGVWVVLGTATYSSDYAMRLRRDLAKLVGEDDASILIANLSSDGELLPSLGPLVGLAKVARGELDRRAYLEQYGHRGPQEFELSIPRPIEDPHWLDQQIARFQASPVDVEGMLAEQRQSFDSAWRRFQSKVPDQVNTIHKRIQENNRRARLREQARSEYIRDRWTIRKFACQVGELAGIGDDIFFLYLDELLALLTNGEGALELIPRRKEIYQRYKDLPAYPSVICGRFDPFRWAKDPRRRGDIYDAAAVIETASKEISRIVRGAPGSAGRVEGFVRLLDNPEQGYLLQQGEILVAVQTDIAWTLIFPRAAAVVTDVGAPLSHAAIVARELGIPAVVGCGDATQRLKTGDRVRVDGGGGIVEILEQSSKNMLQAG